MRSLSPRITEVQPLWAVEGGRVTIAGGGFGLEPDLPEVRFGGMLARLTHASSQALTVVVPPGLEGGHTPVRVSSAPGETAYVEIGAPLATGLHQVDNPVFDDEGNLYVTFSGSRGQHTPVSIFAVRRDGAREPFVSGLSNPTSMAIGPDGQLYVSSRFDGSIHRVTREGAVTTFATDLGVASGIAFASDGDLYVGDRSGSILKVSPDGKVALVASLPASVAAYHLAFGPDQVLYVSAPTLSSCDVIYRVSRSGGVDTFAEGFGRPQGLAFDNQGALYVVDSLAGDSAVFRLRPNRPGERERVLAGGDLIGLAFDPDGGFVLASRESVYRFDVPLQGLSGI